MKITCPACNTTFNIDEKKLQGRSVKLKCSKCNNIFTPSLEPPEQPPAPELIEDTFHQDTGQSPKSSPIDDFSPSSQEGQPMDDVLKNAIDEALKEFQSAGSKVETAPSGLDFGEAVKPENEILGDADFSSWDEPKKDEEFVASGFDLKSEDILSGIKTETPVMDGFESTKIETTEKPPEEPNLIGDLELELTSKKEQPAETSPATPWETKEEDFGLEAPTKTPPPVAPGFPTPPVMTTSRTAPIIKKTTKVSVSTTTNNLLSYILFFMIVISSVVLGFLYRDDLLSLIKPKSSVQNNVKSFTVVSSNYYFLQNIRGQTLFIIEGKAKNISSKTQNFLKLKATLKDQGGNELATKEFYAGNIVPDDTLRTEPAPVVEERFNIRIGDALSNMNIKPGNEVSFMVAFYDIPNVSSFSVEVLTSEEIH